MKNKKVLIAVLNQNEIHPALANWLIQATHDNRHTIKIYYPTDRPIANNRNKICQKFLQEGYDYLLMLDDDIVPQKNLLDLIELDKDIIGIPCPQWREGDLYWVVMDKVSDGYRQVPVEKRGGLRECDAIGTGAILIARRVLEKMKAPFKSNWNNDGILELGEDFYFCERAKEKGFKVWVNWDYPCSHWNYIDMLDVMKLLTKNLG